MLMTEVGTLSPDSPGKLLWAVTAAFLDSGRSGSAGSGRPNSGIDSVPATLHFLNLSPIPGLEPITPAAPQKALQQRMLTGTLKSV